MGNPLYPWEPAGMLCQVCGSTAEIEKSCGIPAEMKKHFTVMPLFLCLQQQEESVISFFPQPGT